MDWWLFIFLMAGGWIAIGPFHSEQACQAWRKETNRVELHLTPKVYQVRCMPENVEVG